GAPQATRPVPRDQRRRSCGERCLAETGQSDCGQPGVGYRSVCDSQSECQKRSGPEHQFSWRDRSHRTAEELEPLKVIVGLPNHLKTLLRRFLMASQGKEAW